MYFSYSHENGFTIHMTADEAKAAANLELNMCRNDADASGELPDDVESICWGKVEQKVSATRSYALSEVA